MEARGGSLASFCDENGNVAVLDIAVFKLRIGADVRGANIIFK